MKSHKDRHPVFVYTEAFEDAKAEAKLQGISLTAWVSRAVRSKAALDRALREQGRVEGPEFRPLDLE